MFLFNIFNLLSLIIEEDNAVPIDIVPSGDQKVQEIEMHETTITSVKVVETTSVKVDEVKMVYSSVPMEQEVKVEV